MSSTDTSSIALTVGGESAPLANDLLRGADKIAAFIFGSDPGGRRKVYHLAGEVRAEDQLPVFRLGAVLCARKSTLLAWIAEREGRGE